MPIRYGSVCSGIEAATAAWRPLGWEAAWFSEIEQFPCDLLAQKYPEIENLGGMTRIAARCCFTIGGDAALAIESGAEQQFAVRRLTVTECERLMGFPDGYTRISYRGRPAEDRPDTPRYTALGNSWAVPVARWVGERIQMQMREANHGEP